METQDNTSKLKEIFNDPMLDSKILKEKRVEHLSLTLDINTYFKSYTVQIQNVESKSISTAFLFQSNDKEKAEQRYSIWELLLNIASL